MTGPGDEAGLMLARRLSFDLKGGKSRNLVVAISENLSTVDAANAAFRGELIRALLLLALVLIGSSALQIQLGLSPLALIKRGLPPSGRVGPRRSLPPVRPKSRRWSAK